MTHIPNRRSHLGQRLARVRRADQSPADAADDALASGSPVSLHRRSMLLAAAALPAFALVSTRPRAQSPDELMAAVRKYTGGKSPLPGKVKFDIATIVENGNSVPVTISVDSAMTSSDYVKSIAIFNEKNPQRDVVLTKLGPRAGRARMSTRIRLATSQHLIAVAELSDGSYWSQGVDVIVALAACIE